MLTMPFIFPVSPSNMRVPSSPPPRLTNTQCGCTGSSVPTLGTSAWGIVTAPCGLIFSIGEAMPLVWAWPGDASNAVNATPKKTVLADEIITRSPLCAVRSFFAKLWPGLAPSQRETAVVESDTKPGRDRAAPFLLGFPQFHQRDLHHRPGIADIID